MKTARLFRYFAGIAALILVGCAAQSPTNQDVACIHGKLYLPGNPLPVKTHGGDLVACEVEKPRR